MTSAPDEIDQRMIHYKHCDSNFYQTGAFNIGRLISTIPQVSLIRKQFMRMPLHLKRFVHPSRRYLSCLFPPTAID